MGYYVYFSKYKQEFDMLNAYIIYLRWEKVPHSGLEKG